MAYFAQANIFEGVNCNLYLIEVRSDSIVQMSAFEATGRREFLMTAILCGSITGCLGTRGNQLGVVDNSDLSVQSSGSAELTGSNVQNDNGNSGLEISTNDTVTDGKVMGKIPTSIPSVSRSTVYIQVDVDNIDDDTEVEIRFQSTGGLYRSIFIGNEYQSANNGVLATKTGSGFKLRDQFQKLPSSEKMKTGQIQKVNSIQFVVRDGDFSGTIWDIGFLFEDRTIVII